MNLKIPAKLERIITRSMAKSLQDRFQNISEIMVELQAPELSEQVTGRFEDLPSQTLPSIAVLAFEDMSPAKDQEYFCNGIAEEIINDLAQVGGLRVASRTSSFAYKGRREDIRDIGRKLGVQSVLRKCAQNGQPLAHNNPVDQRCRWSPPVDRTIRSGIGRCFRNPGRNCAQTISRKGQRLRPDP